MNETIRLGRIAGIPVGANWSVLVVAWLLSWSLAAAYLPDTTPGYRPVEYWIAGISAAVLFLASLLAHELGHAIVATHRDVRVHGITLWLFGGVSRLDDEAATPEDELRIAGTGPAVSVGLAVSFGLSAVLFDTLSAPALLVGVCAWLASVNGLLAVFNLAPAAPLDGGRLLRAWLWHRRGDRISATISAANAGRVFGYVLIALGVLEFALGMGIGGLWLLFLGWFLLSAAQMEKSQALLMGGLAGRRVRELMSGSPVVVTEELTVAALLDDFILAHRFSSFPVVAADGRVTGLVTLAHLKEVPPHRRASARIVDVRTPLEDLVVAAPDDEAIDLVSRLSSSTDGRALVFDGGRLVGVVSPTDVMRAADLSMLRHSG